MRPVVPLAVLAFVLGPAFAGCERARDADGVTARVTGSPMLPVRVDHDVVIRDARFGLLETDDAGVETFVPADELPAVDGATFGWALQVDTDRESLQWRERLRLPKPPADWGDAASDPDVAIAPDGRTVVARGVEAVDDGTLSRFYWALAPGDPAGDYLLEVEIEGTLVARFRFRVPAPVGESGILVRGPAAQPRVAPAAAAARAAAANGSTGMLRSVAWR